MIKKIVRLIVGVWFGLAIATGAFAQEDRTAAPKKPLPKAVQEAKAKAREKRLQAKAKADAEAKAKALDINRASKDELKKLPGITDAYADVIIAKRPFKSKADLVTKNVIPMGLYQSLRKQVAVK
jgi:competence protein ComEA